MATKLYDLVTLVTASVAPVAATLVRVDLLTAGADVVVTMPAVSNTIGQALGVVLVSDDASHSVTFAGPVGSLVQPMSTTGDFALFAWDGAAWVYSAYDIAPGWLTALGSTLVGLYRLLSPTNFNTDYSGNARTLAAAGTVTASSGYNTRGACKSTGAIGQQANAAFQLQGAMSMMLLANLRLNATANQNFAACGLAGAVAATNLQWSLGTAAGGGLQYFHETGAGVDVVYAPTTVSPTTAGWQVLGFTRSATGVVKFYGNGVLLSTSAALGAPTGGASSQLAIGAFQGGTFAANADVAQIGVYSAELTAAQMLLGARQLLGAHN
jgi:hypothetical protein